MTINGWIIFSVVAGFILFVCIVTGIDKPNLSKRGKAACRTCDFWNTFRRHALVFSKYSRRAEGFNRRYK